MPAEEEMARLLRGSGPPLALHCSGILEEG